MILAAAMVLMLTVSGVQAAPILFVHDASGVLGTVDVATGDANVIGNLGVVLTDIAFDPSGNLFGMSFVNLYSVNPTTAATTLIGPHGIFGGNALVFASNGTLFAAGATPSLFTLNPATGASTNLGNIGFFSAGDLAFNGGNFFLSSTTSQLVQIDLANLANTNAVGSLGFPNVFGLATGDDGVLYGVTGTQAFTVNTATGAGSSPVNYGGQGLGASFGSSFFAEATGNGPVVPEPATLILLGTGFAAMLAARRFHKG